MKVVAVTLALLPLCACATIDTAHSPETVAADHALCISRGNSLGTPEYTGCRAELFVRHQREDAGRRAQSNANFMAAMAVMGGAGAAPIQATPTPTGFTKVCSYNTITGPRAITVPAVSLCPLLPPN